MKVLFLTWIFLGSTYAGLVDLDYFDSIIEKVNSLKTTWRAKNNFEPHVTVSSFIQYMGVQDSDSQLLPIRNTINGLIDTLVLPKEFDAREKWPHCQTIRQIRDQGTCGSCWAVAAAGVMSDRMCIVTNGNFTEPISAEELLSCCYDCGLGCNGGIPSQAWLYFMKSGFVTGGELNSNIGCQPYSIPSCKEAHCERSATPSCKRDCTNPTYTNSFAADHRRSIDAYVIPNDVRQIQRDIYLHGPVEADFKAYADLTVYHSGVYQHVTGKYLGGHAVKLIGWGTENGVDYWLVANSWNSRWGDNGYFKIMRGTNECGIENKVTAGIPNLI